MKAERGIRPPPDLPPPLRDAWRARNRPAVPADLDKATLAAALAAASHARSERPRRPRRAPLFQWWELSRAAAVLAIAAAAAFSLRHGDDATLEGGGAAARSATRAAADGSVRLAAAASAAREPLPWSQDPPRRAAAWDDPSLDQTLFEVELHLMATAELVLPESWGDDPVAELFPLDSGEADADDADGPEADPSGGAIGGKPWRGAGLVG